MNQWQAKLALRVYLHSAGIAFNHIGAPVACDDGFAFRVDFQHAAQVFADGSIGILFNHF